MGYFSWQGPAGGGSGVSIPTGSDDQLLGYGPGGVLVAVDAPDLTSVAWTNITDTPATFPPASHSHPWGDLTDVPTTFAPAAHGHPISDVSGLQAALDGKAGGEDFTTADEAKLDGIAEGATANATDAQLRDRATHTGEQAVSTITGLQAALDGLTARQNNWIGTQAEYDALPSVDPAVIYGILPDA